MRRALALAAMIAAAMPALADHRVTLPERYDPEILWFDAPNTTTAGNARIRIVFHGQTGAAALTPNQYWYYARDYQRHLSRLALRMSVDQAEPRARQAAFLDVQRRYPNLRVTGFDLEEYDGPRLTPGL